MDVRKAPANIQRTHTADMHTRNHAYASTYARTQTLNPKASKSLKPKPNPNFKGRIGKCKRDQSLVPRTAIAGVATAADAAGAVLSDAHAPCAFLAVPAGLGVVGLTAAIRLVGIAALAGRASAGALCRFIESGVGRMK